METFAGKLYAIKYEQVRVLGSGAYAKVYQVRERNGNGIYAAKVMDHTAEADALREGEDLTKHGQHGSFGRPCMLLSPLCWL